MTEAVRIQIVLAVAGLLTLIVNGAIGMATAILLWWLNSKQQKRSDDARTAVQEVRTDLRASDLLNQDRHEETATNVKDVKDILEITNRAGTATLDEIRQYLNSERAEFLRKTLEDKRLIFGLTEKPEDARAVDDAEQAYRAHQQGQSAVDAQKKVPTESTNPGILTTSGTPRPSVR